jgi:hypothetical protein
LSFTTNDTANNPVTYTLNCTGNPALTPPTIVKAFSPGSITAGGTSSLGFTITNQNAIPLTGLAFTDNMPAAVTITAAAPTNTCGGTLIATPTTSVITLSAGTVGAGPNATCTISVQVTSNTAGTHQPERLISSTETGAGAASNTPLVNPAGVLPPTLTVFRQAQFSAARPTLTFTISNPNAATIDRDRVHRHHALSHRVAGSVTNTCGAR